MVESTSPPLVTVWRIDLRAERPELAELLSADERDRASRFHFPRDRARYIVAHAALRDVLSSGVGLSPDSLRFTSGAHGKPELAPAGCSFNLSHTPELALVAVAADRAVGIDVEHVARAGGRVAAVERFLSPRESAELAALPAQLRQAALLRIWTCKEAFLKGTVEGLSLPLDSFDVDVDPDRPPRLLETRPLVEQAACWSLHSLPLGTEYVGALAVNAPSARISLRDWVR
jgi:4'-phosphopantetheinyl transferase